MFINMEKTLNTHSNTKIFEINEQSEITSFELDGSTFYFKDEFYKNPKLVLDFILKQKSILWKNWQTPSYNGIYFEDYRHRVDIPEMDTVFSYVSNICKKPPFHTKLTTNVMRLKKEKFNDYENNYWWPHLDKGYTAIIYLNPFSYFGTNIYDIVEEDVSMNTVNEHFAPWRSKNNWEIKATILAKFNRMVLFDGSKFYHGANISNDMFFDEIFRINQVMFFQK